MGLWRCVQYYVITGVIGFLAGRIVPKKWFSAKRFPFRSYPFERDGRCYDRFGIRHWQNKVPDMSKIFPWLMPPKKMTADFRERLPRMLQETCVAELVHILLSLTGLYGLWLWPGIGGAITTVLYIGLFHVPFIMIQRYNRPRLLRVYERLQPCTERSAAVCEC